VIAELGHFCLILALPVALLQAILPLAGAALAQRRWMQMAYPAARVQAVLVVLAFASLAWSFVDNDFSVGYVAANSNTALPLAYRLSAVWGSHEGSMLLWATFLSLWTAAVSLLEGESPLVFRARVLGVLGAVSAGFLAFVLVTSNPFTRLLPPPMEGRDLNPLLQDPGMVAHPPMLYLGYVGFSVSFAFAVAALLCGRLDATWARWARPWTLAAWACLTTGIVLGSMWAYYELGWGGWWFWDPVENASFMPWLAGTALLHSLSAMERRGAFRAWTVLLAILAFSLSLLGTFLVRSGVVTSVHAFAVDPLRGVFILALLGAVTGGALLVFALRPPPPAQRPAFGLASRETLLLSHNLLLAVATATVLLGTLYPLLLDVLGLGRISVGPAYFEQVFVPLMVPAVLLMGLAPFSRWTHDTLPELVRRIRWALAAALVVTALACIALRVLAPMAALGVLLAAWLLASTLASLLQRMRVTGATQWRALRELPASHVGMLLAHSGVGVFIAGAAIVGSQETVRELPMAAGTRAVVAGYTFTFDGVVPGAGPNYDALVARFTVRRDDRIVATLAPERRIYRSDRAPTTEAAVDVGFTRDLYVALGEELDERRWAVRIYVKPFMAWIWAGGLLMAAGGLLAAWDRRNVARRIDVPEAVVAARAATIEDAAT
jgi:cytochrome c-type biogenesis protein CcmF